MKRLEISRLMDEYADTEFFPEGGSAADPEAIKGWVLANVKTRAPAQKKRMPRKKWVTLAAALAAVLLLLVGAGYPYIRHQLANGALSFEQTADGRVTSLVHYGSVIEAENGRLFFNQDKDQRVDITDLVSDETPYIYDGSDPDSGMTYYIIMGGTPECYGYLEWITAPTPLDYEDTPNAPGVVIGEDGRRMRTVYTLECVTCDEEGNTHNDGASCFDFGTVLLFDGMDHPWLLDGMNQLGFPFEYEQETMEN